MPSSAKLPASLVMTGALLAGGALATALSLYGQRQETQHSAEAVATALTQGDPSRGHAAMRRHGCGACHAVPEQPGMTGRVGPALGKIATQAFLAGSQPNDAAHMIAWVQHPQAVEPGVGMPELGLTDQEARDIAAYLYTLR